MTVEKLYDLLHPSWWGATCMLSLVEFRFSSQNQLKRYVLFGRKYWREDVMLMLQFPSCLSLEPQVQLYQPAEPPVSFLTGRHEYTVPFGDPIWMVTDEPDITPSAEPSEVVLRRTVTFWVTLYDGWPSDQLGI